jgi:hypothetical protein
MDLLLNVLLLVSSLTAALAAFGGETWVKSSEPLWDRITGRGWIAATCFVLSFAFGVTKEIRTNINKESAQKTETALRTQLDQAKGQIQELLSNSREQRTDSILTKGFAAWTEPHQGPKRLLNVLDADRPSEWDILAAPETANLLNEYRNSSVRATNSRQGMADALRGMSDAADPVNGINSPRVADAMRESGAAVEELENVRERLRKHFARAFEQLNQR